MTVQAPAPYLDAATITRLLPPEEALAAVQRFYRHQERGLLAVPERIHLHVPGQSTIGLYMPAATPQVVGIKLAHLMPHRTPNVEAEVFLYDAATGRLLFWGDGKPLTALRTAAVSTAAALRLKPDCRRLLVLGSGLQAAAHIEAFAQAYAALEWIGVVARSPQSLARLQAHLPHPLRERMQPATVEEFLPRADCLVTTTPAPQPLFGAQRVPAGCHVTAIGSAAPAMNELPPELFARAQVWLDTERALQESGDCLAAQRLGWRPEQAAGDLFDLLGEKSAPPALAGRAEVTLFKSVGHASQDLALLLRLWERLQEQGGAIAGA